MSNGGEPRRRARGPLVGREDRVADVRAVIDARDLADE